MPHLVWGYTDEKDFETVKARYQRSLKNQFEQLRKKNCPHIGKPCIGCDCISYVEPVAPYKDLTGELWLERAIASILHKPFTEPFMVHWWLARCRKEAFKERDFIIMEEKS